MVSTDLVIGKDVLNAAKMSPEQLALEIAIYLYEKQKLTMGQAKRLAGLDQLSFQKELAKRNVYIHFSVEDVKKDLDTLRKLV